MVSVAVSGENICELVFAHTAKLSLKFILDCALSEAAPYFLWTIDQMRQYSDKKLIKFDLFCLKFSQDSAETPVR